MSSFTPAPPGQAGGARPPAGALHARPPLQPPVLAALVGFHLLVIVASNYLVQLPITLFGWHTTWGAFSFPFIFLATDLTVRLLGKSPARRVIAAAMLPAMLVSYLVSVLLHEGAFQEGAFRGAAALGEANLFVARIAFASFLAYVFGQLLDIQVFDRLRRSARWWVAPAASTVLGNLLDTFVFFAAAFWRGSHPFLSEHWVEIATIDYVIKLVISLALFLPLYGMLLNALVLRLSARQTAASPRETRADPGTDNKN